MDVQGLMQRGIDYCNEHNNDCCTCPLFDKLCINKHGNLCGADRGDLLTQHIEKFNELVKTLNKGEILTNGGISA